MDTCVKLKLSEMMKLASSTRLAGRQSDAHRLFGGEPDVSSSILDGVLVRADSDVSVGWVSVSVTDDAADAAFVDVVDSNGVRSPAEPALPACWAAIVCDVWGAFLISTLSGALGRRGGATYESK